MSLPTAALSEFTPYLGLATLGIAVVALIGFAWMLKFARDLRHNVADELRRELAAGKEAAAVSFPQPVAVSAHDPYVPLSQHTALRTEFTALAEQRRKDIHGLHLKIETGMDKVRTELADEFKELREAGVTAGKEIAVLKNETTSQTRQLHKLDGKMDEVLMRLPRPNES